MSIISLLFLASSAGFATAYPSGITPRHVATFPAGTSWDILLSNDGGMSTSSVKPIVSDDFEVIDIDLFDTDAATIAELKKTKRVICYFSAGTRESWRKDATLFKDGDTGGAVQGGPDGDWPEELWLDVTSENVKKIMQGRIEMASKAGCDAVDPDNVDGFDNRTGFRHPKSAYVSYMKYMADVAKSNNLAIGLKNAVDMIPDLVNDVDFAINEQCHEYSGECAKYKPFTDQNKAVFNIEYGGNACSSPAGVKLSTLVKSENQGLNELGGACDGQGSGTPTDTSPVPIKSTAPVQTSATPSGVGGIDESEDVGDDTVYDNGDEEEKDHNDAQKHADYGQPKPKGKQGKNPIRPIPHPLRRPHRWNSWHRNGRWNH